MSRIDWKSLPDRIRRRRVEAVRTVRERSLRARGATYDRVWHARLSIFSRASDWTHRYADWPLVGRVASTAEGVARRRLELLCAHGIEGYDVLNAKDILTCVDAIEDRGRLLAIRRHESANKARKTVLTAIERALGRMDTVAAPTTVPAIAPAPA